VSSCQCHATESTDSESTAAQVAMCYTCSMHLCENCDNLFLHGQQHQPGIQSVLCWSHHSYF